MRDQRYFFLPLILSLLPAYLPASIPLSEAIRNHRIEASISGIDYLATDHYQPSFYGQCLVLNCRNLTSETIEISEPAGLLLLPDDSSVQVMVLTAKIILKLSPGQKITEPIYAMCTQESNDSPDDLTEFNPGNRVTGKLKTLIDFISVNNYQNDAAQEAIWCLINKKSMYYINSEDTSAVESLRRLVSELTGEIYSKGLPLNETGNRFRLVKGEFVYSIQKPKTVTLLIYNENNQLIKELIKDEVKPAGSHTCKYDFRLPINEEELLKQALIIKFYLNGQLIDERKHVLSSR